jgi:hypothetical protein
MHVRDDIRFGSWLDASAADSGAICQLSTSERLRERSLGDATDQIWHRPAVGLFSGDLRRQARQRRSPATPLLGFPRISSR